MVDGQKFPSVLQGKDSRTSIHVSPNSAVWETPSDVTFIQNLSLKPACMVKDYLDSFIDMLESKLIVIK